MLDASRQPHNSAAGRQIAGAAQHAAASGDAPDASRPGGARRSGLTHFIEFRSRSALSYGHTFAVFGRVGERLGPRNVAGLHPRGDSTFTYLIGHVMMVPAETGVSDGDLDLQYTTARYRVMLTAAEYREIVGHIRELPGEFADLERRHLNCNAFVGIIAHFAGLVSPPTWLLPADFINSMRRMNERAAAHYSRGPTTPTAGAPWRGTLCPGAKARRSHAGSAVARAPAFFLARLVRRVGIGLALPPAIVFGGARERRAREHRAAFRTGGLFSSRSCRR